MAIQIRGGDILSRLRVTVEDSEEVVYQHQGRVVREQQTPPDRLHHYAHTVTGPDAAASGFRGGVLHF